MKSTQFNLSAEVKFAKSLYPDLNSNAVRSLRALLRQTRLSVVNGDLMFVDHAWYVKHSGLLRLAYRSRCAGINARPVLKSCDPANSRWVFRATVFKSHTCKGFTGYGDADPSNVSPLVHGAECRVAETRAVNRALRKAYGIGICSVEEVGSFDRPATPDRPLRKLPPESANGSTSHGNGQNGNGNGTRVRDRLCQLIRQHKLDAELVKSYAVDFCGTKTLREASRDKVETFVDHLADWASKDRNALLCQLNSYAHQKEGAA